MREKDWFSCAVLLIAFRCFLIAQSTSRLAGHSDADTAQSTRATAQIADNYHRPASPLQDTIRSEHVIVQRTSEGHGPKPCSIH